MNTSNPTPRDEFQSDSSRIKKHADLIARADLREAVKVSLLEYQRRLSNRSASAPTPEAASFAWRMAGAQDFVNIFYALSDLTPTRTRSDSDNLLPQ